MARKRTVESDIQKLVAKYGHDAVLVAAVNAKAQVADNLSLRGLGLNPRALKLSPRQLRLKESA